MVEAGEALRLRTRTHQPRVLIFSHRAAVAREAAARFVCLARHYISGRGIFCVALAGGKTPRDFYHLLGSDKFRRRLRWSKVHVFWTDERPVPPDHPQSNYGMAWKVLISHIPIPPENVHRMEAEDRDLKGAVERYQRAMRQVVSRSSRALPRFHLIILGLGADGHTASLFPDSKISRSAARWVDAPFVKHLRGKRMTLTLPVLNAARNLFILVTGSEKAETLKRVLEGKARPPLPAQMLRPKDGEVVFLADSVAARLLARR